MGPWPIRLRAWSVAPPGTRETLQGGRHLTRESFPPTFTCAYSFPRNRKEGTSESLEIRLSLALSPSPLWKAVGFQAVLCPEGLHLTRIFLIPF